MDQNKKLQQHFSLRTQDSWSHIWRQPKFDYLASAHYNGEQFGNPVLAPDELTRANFIKWLLKRKSQTWELPKVLATEPHQARQIPKQRPQARLDDWQIWFVGHSTVLLQIGPYNFLTDPVWCDYVSPWHGKGPKRICDAGLALEELPKIDAVLLSHNHYDHMDLATLNWLHDKFQMLIYTGLGNAWYLPKHFHVVEMEWWQTEQFNEVFEITYTPAQHSSGRGLRDQNRALWGGFALKCGKQYAFFAGDTGYSEHFKAIYQQFGAPRIALLPIGAYEPRALMRYLHMNPEDALHAHHDLHAQCSIAIHYRSFQLTDEARDQPEIDLQRAMKKSSKFTNPFYCLYEGRRLIV